MDYDHLDEDQKAEVVRQEISNAESEHFRLSLQLEDLPEEQQASVKDQMEVLEKRAARLKRDAGKVSKS